MLNTCTSCGGEMKHWLNIPIDARKNESTPFGNIERCNACDLGVISPLPAEKDIPAFYDLDVYYTHGTGHMKRRKSSLGERALEKLASIADKRNLPKYALLAKIPPEGSTICDLGCGFGNIISKFADRGFSVIGVDPDPNARAQAKVPILEGTAEHIPAELSGKQFDFVIMTHALEHCRNPNRAVENAYALTSPGGLCYIEVPNCDAAHFREMTVCSEMFDVPRHIHFFTPAALEKMVRAKGFDVERRMFRGYCRQFGPGWRDWEMEIARRIKAHSPSASPPVHSFGRSATLFLKSFWQRPEKKYDSVGLLLRKPAAA